MIYKIIEKLKWFIWTPINRLYFMLKGVHYGKNLRSNGRILIRKNGGEIAIGDDVRINSGLSYNPIGCGYRTSIQVLGGRLRIGSHVGMSNVSITCTDEIIIGDWTDMGDGVKLFDTDFHSMVPSIRHSTKDFENAKKKGISIGKNVFVGANAMILKGSCLDDECCIGAGAIVTKNIGEKETWVGNPARKIVKM